MKPALVVHDKKIIECDFWGHWPTPVLGANIGDTVDDIGKTIGKPNRDIKNANGTEMMTWNRSDGKSKFSITFDKDHKSNGLIVEPLK